MQVRVLGWNIAIGGEAVDLGTVVEAIRRSGAEIAGLQECEGNAPRIAALLGWAHVDERHQIISRWPIVEPHDAEGRYVLVHLAPDRVIAVADVHLPSDPYGPYELRAGAGVAHVVELEREVRLRALAPSLDRWRVLIAAGVPLVVTGDFNTPSHRDWGPGSSGHRTADVPWPVSVAMEASGLGDLYRSAEPARPGITWTHGFPHPRRDADELLDRIDLLWGGPGVRVIDCTLLGPSGVPDVGVAVDPWPSDHLGVVATVELEPVPPPPYVAVTGGRRAQLGDTIPVRWSIPRATSSDRLALVPSGRPLEHAVGVLGLRETGPTGLVRFGTGGLTSGPYDVVLVSEGDDVGRVTVHLVEPGALPRVDATRDGSDLEVVWYDAPGRKFDWIGVHRLGDADLRHGLLAQVHTGASVTGRHRFRDVGDGPFTVRLFHDDSFAVAATVDVPATA